MLLWQIFPIKYPCSPFLIPIPYSLTCQAFILLHSNPTTLFSLWRLPRLSIGRLLSVLLFRTLTALFC